MIIKKLKSKLNKKEKGFLDDFLPILIFIMILCFGLLFFVETHSAINKKEEINAIARQYTLRMETQGCLTDADISDLVNSLNDAGFTDNEGNALTSNTLKCDYSGKGSSTSVGYGNIVDLKFTVYTKQKLVNTESFDLWSMLFEETYSPISVEYHSTSKE